ncbi:MAG: hypothetical protein P9M14_12910 [Candidatus Alcyoniella australis]|nr:hypothetical protein [Candidatus Alcyoniella australis]
MVAETLRRIGPLRVLAESMHGGLGKGNMGVIAARAGVGKSACLVQFALDALLRGQQTLHVALDHPVAHVRQWYDEILDEAARLGLLKVSSGDRLELERLRNIQSFLDRGFSAARLGQALDFLDENMDFKPTTIVIDGLDLEKAGADQIAALKVLAREKNVELWLSALTHRHQPPDQQLGMPQPIARLAEHFSVVIKLRPEADKVLIELLKDHDEQMPGSPPLRLDPITMLLVEQDV